MYKIKKEKLTELFRCIASARELYLPVKISGQVNFASWEEGDEVDLDTLKTVKSPKDAFFPQSESLYTCKQEEKKIKIEQAALQEQQFVVFGMKACDIKGVQVLDRVFLSDPVDTFYAARRQHGAIVALACHEPEETCFCKVFGVDAADPETSGADVASWMLGDTLYWKPVTEKGWELTRLAGELLEPAKKAETKEPEGEDTVHENAEKGEIASAALSGEPGRKDTDGGAVFIPEIQEEKRRIRAMIDQLPYSQLSLEGWNGESLNEKFNSPLWEELYKPCLACGTCTFVCPTCQCYDIKDYDTGHGVQRYRCWDSCMYSDFTMMAHGNNRTSQMQRFRQRFMHKLVYFPANNGGEYSCVGCGRCVEKCPASLNIVKVIKKFSEERKKQGGEQV